MSGKVEGLVAKWRDESTRTRAAYHPAACAARRVMALELEAALAADAQSVVAGGEVVGSGCIVIEEASCVPHTHPQYGPGLFFTEDAILATQHGDNT